MAFVGFLVGAIGCDGSSNSDGAWEVTPYDSAGVRIVDLPPLGEIEAPRWGTRSDYSSDRIDIDLHEVRAGVFRSDGSLLLANSGYSELLLIDSAGGTGRSVGRAGDGPGEYRHVNWLQAAEDGTILVYDPGLLRITTLSPDLTVIDTRSLDVGGVFSALLPLAVAGRDTILATEWMNNVIRIGEWRDTVPLLRIEGDGRTRADTLGLWPGKEKAGVQVAAGQMRQPVAFSREAWATGRNGIVAIGSSDSLRIEVLDAHGSVRLALRGPPDPRRVEARHQRQWAKSVLEQVPIEAEEVVAAWTSGPRRETFPAFEHIVLDDDENIWVGEALVFGASKRTWTVFSLDGRIRAKVELPTSDPHPLFLSPEILDIRNGRIAILLRDRFGEQVIRVFSYRAASAP